MKTISDILTADDPERYFIRYNKKGQKRIITFQVNEDDCTIVDSLDRNKVKDNCIVYYDGYLQDICKDFKAIDNGILLPDICLLRWFNKEIQPYL